MAKTLGELERKLLELERTLTAIGHDETAGQEAGPAPAAQQDPGFIRLIDETIERDEPAPAGVTPAAAPYESPPPPPAPTPPLPPAATPPFQPPPRRDSPRHAASADRRAAISAGRHAAVAAGSSDDTTDQRRAVALSRSAGAHHPGARPRLRRAARPPKLRDHATTQRTPDLVRPRRTLARHHRRGGPAQCGRARIRERPGRHDGIRHVGGLSPPARLDRRPARRGARTGARDQRFDAGGRVPVRAPRAPRRRGDRRAPHLRPHAAVAAPARRATARGRAAARRHRHGGARQPAQRRGGSAAEARPHHPQLPEPRRLHALARPSAGRCWSWPPRTGSWCSRTTPMWRCASAGSRCPRCCRWRPSAWSTRPPSRRPCALAFAWVTSWDRPS